jgi:hypothetical protein
MAHTLSERRLKERLKELDPKGWRERQERPRREARHAKRIVELWNKRAQAGRPVSFYPTVKTALLAVTAVLEVLWPARPSARSISRISTCTQARPSRP